MDILTNYHTHNRLCDGEGPAEDYVEAAAAKGFAALGFSSHAPLPPNVAVPHSWTLSEDSLPDYLAEIRRLRDAWAGKIQVYLGLEIDYIPGSQAPSDPKWDALGLDYRIGSVHSTMPALSLGPLLPVTKFGTFGSS